MNPGVAPIKFKISMFNYVGRINIQQKKQFIFFICPEAKIGRTIIIQK